MPRRLTVQAIMDTGHKTYTQSIPTLALLQTWYRYQMRCTREEWYDKVLIHDKLQSNPLPVLDG